MRADGPTAMDVRCRLELPAAMMDWLERVERPAGTSGPVLPADDAATDLLRRMGVAPSDREESLAARPDPIAVPELWWVLERAFFGLLKDMGRPEDDFAGWPALPDHAGAIGRHLYVWLFLAMTPHTVRYYAERGIPDDVCWASLQHVGRQMAAQRLDFGRSGLYWLWALPLIFRGTFFRLGRLAFQRGTGVLHVHIPEGEPLDPAACDASLDQAQTFFPRHFPEEPVDRFVCHSWLLDDQWAAWLPATSNIVRFQRRFRLEPWNTLVDQPRGDDAILELVFNRPLTGSETAADVIAQLPQDTSLQRAFVAHLARGGHWHTRRGWLPW